MIARRIAKGIVKFLVAFVAMTIACTILWELCVDRVLYNCTDSVPLDYLTPGDFAHDFAGTKVVTVKEIVPDDNMSHPDTIKEGWTNGRLQVLRLGFFAASVVISVALARVPWRRKVGREATETENG